MSTELTTIDPNANALKSQSAWIARRNETLAKAKTLTAVDDAFQLDEASFIDTDAKKLIKSLGEERLRLTRPLDAAKKSIMDAEKEMTAELDREQKRVNGLMNAYATKQLLAQREADRLRQAAERELAEAQAAREEFEAAEEAKRQAEAAKNDNPFGEASAEPTVAQTVAQPTIPEPEPVHIPYVEAPRASASSFQLVDKFEVTDPSKVAREFLTVDESKIRTFLAYRKKMGDDISTLVLDGVKIWQESQTKAR